jgi:hypothetical protein
MPTPLQILISVVVVAAVLYGASVLFRSLAERSAAARELLRSQEEKLDALAADLKRVKEVVEDLELPESERKQRAKSRLFEAARELPMPFLRNLPAGTVLKMMSRSKDESAAAVFDEFEYRHERVGEDEASLPGKRIHGSSRRSGTEEWSPYTFVANDFQATTSNGALHLRRRIK